MLSIIIAYFIMGPTSPTTTEDIIKTTEIYGQYYSGPDCDFQSDGRYEDNVVRDCGKFFIAYDLENELRERHRKQTLLLHIFKLRYGEKTN